MQKRVFSLVFVRLIIAVYLDRELKGRISTRGNSFSISFLLIPKASPAKTVAFSVGLPKAFQILRPPSSIFSIVASERSTEARKISNICSLCRTCVSFKSLKWWWADPLMSGTITRTNLISPSVIVPVLSTQITVVLPKVSAAKRFLTNPW